MQYYQALPKSGRLLYFLYRGIWSSLDLFFPPICGGCGQNGIRWCQACDQGVETLVPPYCPICGQKQKADDACQRCKLLRPTYNQLRS